MFLEEIERKSKKEEGKLTGENKEKERRRKKEKIEKVQCIALQGENLVKIVPRNLITRIKIPCLQNSRRLIPERNQITERGTECTHGDKYYYSWTRKRHSMLP